jgi:hypothetical protein
MKSLFIIITIFTASLGYAKDQIEPQFTRQECIQKVALDWGGYNNEEIEESIKNISLTLRELVRQKKIVELPSYTFPFNKRDEWYLQYSHDCMNKSDNTLKIIELLSLSNTENQPAYEVVDIIITPSPKTISLEGEFWKQDQY